MQIVIPRHLAELLGGKVQECPFAIGAKGDLTRVGLGVGNQFLRGFERGIWPHDQGQKVGGHHRHGCKVFARVVSHLGHRQGKHHHVAPLATTQGVAIVGRLFDQGQAELTARAWLVVHHDGLTQALTQSGTDHPGQDVATVASARGHDHAYGFVRVTRGLSPGAQAHQGHGPRDTQGANTQVHAKTPKNRPANWGQTKP